MKLRNLIVPAALGFSSFALGATDGGLSSTASTGNTVVSISINDQVQVSVQQNVALTPYVVGSNSTGNTGICIYHRDANTAGLTLTSGNDDGSGSFFMNNAGALLEYSVQVGATAFASGAEQAGLAANRTSTNCGSTWNHTINVTALAAALDAATTGSYTDTLVIRVEPN